MKQVWITKNGLTKTSYKGCEISRGPQLASGRYFYYTHWVENANYAAPHHRMSERYRTLQQAKRAVDELLYQEQVQDYFIVRRINDNEFIWLLEAAWFAGEREREQERARA